MMYCDDTDVCLERVLVRFGTYHMALWQIGPVSVTLFGAGYTYVHRHPYTGYRDRDTLQGQCLVWACCDATDVGLVRALVNRASTWGVAGFCVLCCH